MLILSKVAINWLTKQNKFKIVGCRGMDGSFLNEWLFLNITPTKSYMFNIITGELRSHTPSRDLNARVWEEKVKEQQSRGIFDALTFSQQDEMMLEFLESEAKASVLEG